MQIDLTKNRSIVFLFHSTFLGLIIFALSFLQKLLSYHFDPVITRDGYTYINLAQSWFDTGVYPDTLNNGIFNWVPPLYLFLVKSVMSLGISAEMTGIWINLFLGSLTPLIAYGITYEIIQRKDIAICAALLTTVNPSISEFSTGIQRDVSYLFFIGIVLWFLSAGIRHRKWGYWLGAGISCGCAILIRFESIEFVVIIPLIQLFLCRTNKKPWKKAICWIAAFLLSFFGSCFFLSCIMGIQNSLLSSYDLYFRTKYVAIEKQLQAGMETPEK